MEASTETRILMHLKSRSANLEEIARVTGISKMAALKHIKQLEERGLVERRIVKARVGRPYYSFSYTEAAKSDFRTSDSLMLNAFMDYLKARGMDDIVEGFLKSRYEKSMQRYETEVGSLKAEERISKLVSLRDKEHYMPELHRVSGSMYELLEKNCPIFKMAKNYPLACSLEQNLFASVLGMDVEATHRQSDGEGICRFLIRKREI